MDGHQRRGAGRVDRHARAVQAQDVGDAARGRVQGIAAYEIGINPAESIRSQDEVGIVAVGDPHKNSGVATRQPVRRMTGVLQGLEAHLEEQTLLRIHACRLRGVRSRRSGDRIGPRHLEIRRAACTSFRVPPDPGRNTHRDPNARAESLEIASTPLHSNCQKASGESAPPGKRQPMPTMAMGSLVEESETGSPADSLVESAPVSQPSFCKEEGGEVLDVGVVEGEGGKERKAEGLGETIFQLDGEEGIHAHVKEALLGIGVVRGIEAEDGGDFGLDIGQQVRAAGGGVFVFEFFDDGGRFGFGRALPVVGRRLEYFPARGRLALTS